MVVGRVGERNSKREGLSSFWPAAKAPTLAFPCGKGERMGVVKEEGVRDVPMDGISNKIRKRRRGESGRVD
jgi:hypothetical protein